MSRFSLAVVVCCAFFTLSVVLTAQRGGGGTNPIASLKGVSIPQRPNLPQYVADNQSLVALGKALFWDVQVGSDGQTSCATCHFHAGGDHRVTNVTAGPTTSTAAVRANTTLTAADFPFHAVGNTNVVGSAGVVKHTFVAITDGAADEVGGDSGGAGLFVLGGVKVRQVTSRNTPSVINAVFNLRNFWDGRASNIFNAATPFGVADARAQVLASLAGTLTPQAVRLDGSSLASQAVAPPLNGLEMSYDGRAWADLGRKMLSLTPLARQAIARDDSVLGSFVSASGIGFRPDVTYASLVVASFQRTYAADGAQAAENFGLFFGLALQAYESTLVSDDSPVDRFLAGDAGALNATQQQGLNQFRSGDAQCTQCHQGPELSAAGITTASRGNPLDPRALGLFRTGVSAIGDDPGASGIDAFGAPLFPASPTGNASGAFKAPGLRNVEFTGPYFHTGGVATIEQVLQFYARNGDVQAGGNLGPGIGNIRLNQQEQAQIVAFLLALTDDRVRFERAPFDHPSICVPVGYAESAAAPLWALVPEVGRTGNAAPLQTFAEQLQGIGRDGSRAHALQQACTP